jgi:hypothetical protein
MSKKQSYVYFFVFVEWFSIVEGGGYNSQHEVIQLRILSDRDKIEKSTRSFLEWLRKTGVQSDQLRGDAEIYWPPERIVQIDIVVDHDAPDKKKKKKKKKDDEDDD